MQQISLSPSKLNIFNECPRCFWDSYAAKCPKPRGIFPSLPGGMDKIIKAYFDIYRGSLPPELQKKVRGQLFPDRQILNAWRNWRTGLKYYDAERAITLIGALDECLVDGELYIPLDYKTKGSRPETDGSEYYQTQLDCYNLMLESAGYRTCGMAYLVYFYPLVVQNSVIVRESSAGDRLIGLEFGIKIFEIAYDAKRVKEIIIKAAECLRGKRPQSAPNCEHCRYLQMEDILTKNQEGGK